MSRRIALLGAGAWLLAACGGTAPEGAAAPGDPELFGIDLVVEAASPYTQREDFRPRLRRYLADAAAFWGRDPGELAGWTIHLQPGAVTCNGQRAAAMGCTDTHARVIWLGSPGCEIEDTNLAHELGHAFLRDDAHHDARWHDAARWRSLYDRLHADDDRDVCAPWYTPRWWEA
jgi:hypothetical protein